MREFRVRDSAWQLYASVLFNGLVMALICSGALGAVNLWIRVLIFLNAFVLCLGGLYLILKEPFRKALLDEPTIESKSICLGAFHLNGHSFEAYERETDYGGRQFRLRSYPSVNPDQEAAIIRYLVHEGLIDDMWPQSSKKIQEEANWAFFS
jgi:hypothetical protein